MPSAIPVESPRGSFFSSLCRDDNDDNIETLPSGWLTKAYLYTEAFTEKGPHKQAKQSALAKLVMNSSLRQDQPTSAPTSAPNNIATLPASTVRDVAQTSHHVSPTFPATGALRALHDMTETPPSSRSVNSTAPSSPRM